MEPFLGRAQIGSTTDSIRSALAPFCTTSSIPAWRPLCESNPRPSKVRCNELMRYSVNLTRNADLSFCWAHVPWCRLNPRDKGNER